MSGHRKKPKRVVDTERLASDMKAMRATVTKYQDGLRVDCDHFKALWALRDALILAEREIVGESSPVAHVTPSMGYGLRKLPE